MFLKFPDDLELQREDEAKLAGKKFNPGIELKKRASAVQSANDTSMLVT